MLKCVSVRAFVLALALPCYSAAEQTDDTIIETPTDELPAGDSLPEAVAPDAAGEADAADAGGADAADAGEAVAPDSAGGADAPDAPGGADAPDAPGGADAGATTPSDRLRPAIRPTIPRQETGEAEDKHVVSQSRMFSVSGGEALRMGAIASRADELRAQLIGMLGLGNDWRYSISIRLLGSYSDQPSPNPVRLHVRVIGQEPNFQIRIFCGGGIKLEKLDRAVIAMVLYEYALRDLTGDELPDVVSMPEWLVSGLYETILCRTGKADRRTYQTLAHRAEMPDPQKIVSTPSPGKLDAASRRLYDVSCGLLISSLMKRPGGTDRVRELIKAASLAEEGPYELISKFFLELGVDDNLLSEWWALELAAYAAPMADELLTPMESDKALSAALTLHYFDPYTAKVRPISLDDAYAVSRLEDWQGQARTNVDQLLELSYRCFPGYQVIVTEYIRAIGELMQGSSPDEVQGILGPIRELRQAYMQTGIRGRDYLDWYEITTREGDAPADVEAYMETMRLLRREQPGPDTPMSRYLDDIEALHLLKEGEGLPQGLREEMMRLHPRPTGKGSEAARRRGSDGAGHGESGGGEEISAPATQEEAR